MSGSAFRRANPAQDGIPYGSHVHHPDRRGGLLGIVDGFCARMHHNADMAGGASAYSFSGKRVYVPTPGDFVGDPRNLSDAKENLGGKGANLADMRTMKKIPVPALMTITTEVCKSFLRKRKIDPAIDDETRAGICEIEQQSGKSFFDFGKDDRGILLLSVRSGARVSMPGMMDTILDVGMNDGRVRILLQRGEDAWFVYDTYRRFLQSFGKNALGVKGSKFEAVLTSVKKAAGVEHDHQLSAEQMQEVVAGFKGVLSKAGVSIPDDPWEQLLLARNAVFKSSNSKRKRVYCEANGLPLDLPTAVNIQEMVFGNRNKKSGSGVAFSRNNTDGTANAIGTFLVCSQGEEVVSGARTPAKFVAGGSRPEGMSEEVFAQLMGILKTLEERYGDVQDVEFTVENGKLYILQTRTAKRWGQAAFKIAHDMVMEAKLTKEQAVMRIDKKHVQHIFMRQIDPKEKEVNKPAAVGTPGSAGAGKGVVVFSPKEALKIWEADQAKPKGERRGIILLREETNTDDFDGMIKAGQTGGGVLTAKGGAGSHAAVVCGSSSIPAVVGCGAMAIDERRGIARIGGKAVKRGDMLTIDGATGEVFIGGLKLVDPVLTEEAKTVLGWADGIRKLEVFVNADTPEEARKAVELYGAEGIGLVRTEHMFREGERLEIMRQMIIAKKRKKRIAALNLLLPMQRGDFEGIFAAMGSRPVTVRYLDPPLHEFLPNIIKLEKKLLAAQVDLLVDDSDENLQKVQEIRGQLEAARRHAEPNPMLGNRGIRLLLQHPEIIEMQTRAVIEAAANTIKNGVSPTVKIMLPLVIYEKEFTIARKVIDRTTRRVMKEKGVKFKYQVGTMIEAPRAVRIAGRLAKVADFFSFGTNDLTAGTLELGRDEAPPIVGSYIKLGIMRDDPFITIDEEVADSVRESAIAGRAANPNLSISLCGEHGGDPATIEILDRIREEMGAFDCVSCTGARVPVARIAAAQAAIKNRKAA